MVVHTPNPCRSETKKISQIRSTINIDANNDKRNPDLDMKYLKYFFGCYEQQRCRAFVQWYFAEEHKWYEVQKALEYGHQKTNLGTSTVDCMASEMHYL